MACNYLPQGMQFNPDAIKRMKEIDSQLEKETKEGTLNADKKTQLNMEKLLRGMQMNNFYGSNYRAMFPY